jgi:pimeloyl-ACP methyl ester carboxylesterase
MLARWLRLALILELFIGFIWGVLLVRLGGWTAFSAVLAVIALLAGGRLLLMVAVAGLVGQEPPGVASGGQAHGAWPGHLLIWVREWWAFSGLPLAAAFEFFAPDAHPSPRVPSSQQHPPMLLLHGYGCNRGVWWWLRRCLSGQHGVWTATLTLEPMFGDIDGYTEQIAQRIARLQAVTGAMRVIIVAQGMGGLAALAYLRRYGEDHVERLITLDMPLMGSSLARLAPGRNARQMEPGSAWLRELRAFFVDMPLHIPCFSCALGQRTWMPWSAVASRRGAAHLAETLLRLAVASGTESTRLEPGATEWLQGHAISFDMKE